MSYYVKFNDITSMQGQTHQTIQQWGNALKELQESIASLANQSELQGEAMTSAKSYMTEVHGTFIQTLTLLMNEYIASFLLYRDGYYQIDTHNHAGLPEDVYKGLYSDLGKSKQRFEQQLEQLTTAKLRVAGLVNYQGTSHTKTKFTYEKLMKDIKHLDESITQYEEMHVRQDLQEFKELLAATKSLLAEHSSRDRSLGSYQVGDFRQLPSMNRFMLAAQQSAIYLNDHMPQIQEAGDREKVRVYAEERTKQGAMELVFGVLTIIAGATAIAMSGGAMWPIVTSAFKYGALALSMSGASNSIEAVQNIYYGLSGDGKSFAMNPIRDTLFLGNGELYHSVGQIFSLTTGAYLPIAQTQSIAQGLWQFAWGVVGALATGQAAYHGTKLLGGSEETAQLMNLFGNLVGGYKFSKIAENFSLNTIRVPKVESALEIENLVLENIKASKAARESSGVKDFVTRERYLEKIFDKLTPEERELIFSISRNAPKVEYIKGTYTKKDILDIKPDSQKGILRPDVEDYLTPESIEAHIQQFKNGAIKIQKFTPEEGGYNNGAVGNIKDHVAFVMPKEVGEILIKVTKGDPELLEDILGLHRGDLGPSPVAIEIPPESIKNPRIPNGNEASAFEDFWRPGGQTFPGNIPEAVIDEVPWGEFTIRKLGGD